MGWRGAGTNETSFAIEVCLRLARLLVEAKVEGQYRYLLRATRKEGGSREQLEKPLGQIKELIKAVPTSPDRDSLRGLEGMAAVHYFAGLRAVLNMVHRGTCEPISDAARR